MSLFKLGDFKSHSGNILSWKIECDALTEDDWQCLAVIIAKVVGPFGSVEGVPQGGLPLATALQRHVTHGELLIVDDVLTTGISMEDQRYGRTAKGAVIFARGPCPVWVKPIFKMVDLALSINTPW